MLLVKLMKTILISIAFLLLSILIIGLWMAGSHGNLRFRYWMLEDWIMSFLLISCISIPVILLVKQIRKAQSNSASKK